jgi:hypothetical protein
MPAERVQIIVLMLCGGAVIVMLSAYAMTLWWRLQRQTSDRQHSLALAESARERLAGDINASITILARAMLQEQVSKTEASIRISTLARGLPAEAFERAMYYPFDELAKATAHIPTHQRWRRLTSIQQDRLDAERKVLEQDHAEAVNGAATALLERQ